VATVSSRRSPVSRSGITNTRTREAPAAPATQWLLVITLPGATKKPLPSSTSETWPLSSSEIAITRTTERSAASKALGTAWARPGAAGAARARRLPATALSPKRRQPPANFAPCQATARPARQAPGRPQRRHLIVYVKGRRIAAVPPKAVSTG